MKHTVLTTLLGVVIAALIGLAYLTRRAPSEHCVGAGVVTSPESSRAAAPARIVTTAMAHRPITVVFDRPPPPGLPPWTTPLATMPEPPPAADGLTPAPLVPEAAVGR